MPEDKGVTETDRLRMATFLHVPEGEAVELLPELATLCDRLEKIARKELDGKPLNFADDQVITGYGRTLAALHFYDSAAYLEPRDDFPQVVPVFFNLEQGETLYAGVARPEAIFAIIPYGKRLVLHRGAVLSYREFRRPGNQPLDDEKWHAEVRSGKVPPPLPQSESFRAAIGEHEAAAIIARASSIRKPAGSPAARSPAALVDAIRSRHQSLNAEDVRAMAEELAQRATNEDVPALLDLLGKKFAPATTPLAICLADRRFDLKPHRGRLVALLTESVPETAAALAFVLANRPEEIDVGLLADGYAKQPPFARRFSLCLVGQSKGPGARGAGPLVRPGG